ncbi:hypothetical protein LTR16_011975, partial [Cryomyces antarcticus]
PNAADIAPPPRRTAGYHTYNSPLGSGHLLEPIEEVRYSLETDSGRLERDRLSPEPTARAAATMQSPARKITGPRPMGSRSPSEKLGLAQRQSKPVELHGTVRRKPVARSQGM